MPNHLPIVYIVLVRVHSLKKVVKHINVNENKINVFTPDVGGGFGMKILIILNMFLH